MAEGFLCLALYNMEKGNLQLSLPNDIKNVLTEPDDIVIFAEFRFYKHIGGHKNGIKYKIGVGRMGNR